MHDFRFLFNIPGTVNYDKTWRQQYYFLYIKNETTFEIKLVTRFKFLNLFIITCIVI